MIGSGPGGRSQDEDQETAAPSVVVSQSVSQTVVPAMFLSFLGVVLITLLVFFGVYAIARATLGQ